VREGGAVRCVVLVGFGSVYIIFCVGDRSLEVGWLPRWEAL
jgi:hypothetical protein